MFDLWNAQIFTITSCSMTTSYNTCTKPLKNSLHLFHLGYCLIVQTGRTRGYNGQEQVKAGGINIIRKHRFSSPHFLWLLEMEHMLAYDPRERFFFLSSVYNHIKKYSSTVIIDGQQSQFTPLTDSPAEFFFSLSLLQSWVHFHLIFPNQFLRTLMSALNFF